jgi:hypothetical protein
MLITTDFVYIYMRVYSKVSGLAAWSENCKWYSSLPRGAVVSLFCESSEFCHHNPLGCFSTSVYFCCCLFCYDSFWKHLDTTLYAEYIQINKVRKLTFQVTFMFILFCYTAIRRREMEDPKFGSCDYVYASEILWPPLSASFLVSLLFLLNLLLSYSISS